VGLADGHFDATVDDADDVERLGRDEFDVFGRGDLLERGADVLV
jgi:hypothetical protein